MHLKLNDNQNYTKMGIRQRKRCKQFFLFGCFALALLYATILLVGDLRLPKLTKLTSLHRCPACYGISICPELYSNLISVERHSWRDLLFNVKNIYYGYTKSNRRVVLKNLAYDSELQAFDDSLCKVFDLQSNCKPIDLINASEIDKKMVDLVRYNFSAVSSGHPRTGLTFCPYPEGIYEFVRPMLESRKGKTNKSDLLNIWTMLSLNAEPILLQVIPKSQGWHVPAYAGVCGRLEVVADEGTPLASLEHISWRRKLKIAKQILDMAMDFTYKHDRYRFYFYDWSADNIVVNEKDEVSFVDLEDVIVLDKHITPQKDLPEWYQRYIEVKDDVTGYMFSVDSICSHHLSDHNVYSACYVLYGDDKPFLKPVPKGSDSTVFTDMLKGCLRGPDRFKTAASLQRYISDLLDSDSVSGVG